MSQLSISGEIGTQKSAVISDCKRYRYELCRTWDAGKRLLVVCMLNPSTADDEKDDPTLRELTYFGKLWGYSGLIVVNLNAFRASHPSVMMAEGACVGPKNGEFIESALTFSRHQGTPVLAAWGNGGNHLDRDEWFISRARLHTVSLVCLGRNKDGSPKHPMSRGRNRIPRDQQPLMFRNALEVM
ncbi:DUF1643 domain-containing protein [Rhizobium grahamii]|uniref:DUF1643 domain-containing protein n=1 Tax=Rhizobium grahamii CCGE 502 TaxID=990285 RepID=S3IL37_9HYPH|nr:DUF1643 domain-containing protein [Rhizobium grahamii]EPE99503.1 hypothetical protein RGCCGE502_04950 [Rhizobium grahamii CCGE 502]